MTREEFYNEIFSQDTMEDARNVINKLYDDFESRTCENCIYYEEDTGKYGLYEGSCLCYIVQEMDLMTVKKDFGCNNFERKDDGL